MADSVGIDRMTGQVITDWDHVRQSIAVILTTPRFTRVMRRLFGSGLPTLIDAPMNDRNVLNLYVACAEALQSRVVEGRQYGEPRFKLTNAAILRADADGRLTLLLVGQYMPRGHVGDNSVEREARLEVVL